MSLSRDNIKTRINSIIDSEVLDRVEDKLSAVSQQSLNNQRKVQVDTPYLLGQKRIIDSTTFDGNIEKFYGIAQIPVGIVGPLKVNGPYSAGEYLVPLATTEGALVASYNRGAKAITLSGGANVICVSETMTRSPGFVFKNIIESTQFVAWVSENFSDLKDVCRTTTRHGHLEDFDSVIDGRYVWINFKYVCGDASGQNMVTISTDAICKFIQQVCPIQPQKVYIEANLSGDKKATRFSQYTGRGKNVIAEVVINKSLVKRLLHTTPQEIVEYSYMAMVGGIHAGSIGINGHFANALAALFIACGQDVACVAESAIGTSKAELTKEGDLYVSVTLPNLVVGTVGGGTHLPTQAESLDILGCLGKGKSKKFAEICAATVLAGEISIASAITAGHFTQAHKKYGRLNASKANINNAHADQKGNNYA